MLKFYNTLARKKQIFRPLRDKQVGLYTCGPTVYDFAHIGNLRYYLFADILRRTLEYNGYKVKHVMNITDVGHLTSDADLGDDKLDKKARAEKKSVWDIAAFYTKDFLASIKKLNIKRAHILSPATGNIKEQLALIKQLFKNGLAYETSEAVYFDVSKFKNYTKLSRQKLSQKITGARDEVVVDKEKRNPQDFALWFKLVGRFKNHAMRWPSPWGEGFPGWHIECSAISVKFLGQPFDIHTGGVDHVNVHHTNEIAQSEGAFGKSLARFWIHSEFLLIDHKKMSKSLHNFYTLRDLEKRNFNPLAFRYLVLTTHYRSKLNFTWKSLEGAENAYNNLQQTTHNLQPATYDGRWTPENAKKIKIYEKKFIEAINDDLNTSKALALVWQVLKDNEISAKAKRTLILKFDEVLGLGLNKIKPIKIPEKIKRLATRRETLRRNKQFVPADRLRKKIERLGWMVEDAVAESRILRKS